MTNGKDAAATFALAPDGRRAYVSMRSEHEVMGCIPALDQGRVYYTNSRRHNHGPEPEMLPAPLPDELKRRLNDNEWFFRRVHWSHDGTRLLGDSGPWACAVDVPGGRMRWLARTDGPVAWSSDDRLLASIASNSAEDEYGRLLVLDAGRRATIIWHLCALELELGRGIYTTRRDVIAWGTRLATFTRILAPRLTPTRG